MTTVKRLPRLIFNKKYQNAIHDSPLSLKVKLPVATLESKFLKASLTLGKFKAEKTLTTTSQPSELDLTGVVQTMYFDYRLSQTPHKFNFLIISKNACFLQTIALKCSCTETNRQIKTEPQSIFIRNILFSR